MCFLMNLFALIISFLRLLEDANLSRGGSDFINYISNVTLSGFPIFNVHADAEFRLFEMKSLRFLWHKNILM